MLKIPRMKRICSIFGLETEGFNFDEIISFF
jgi:hypothetical protein